MKYQKITRTELLEILRKIDGKSCSFVSIVTNTDARLRRTNNPYGEVRKISKVYGLLNFNYRNSVNKQRSKEHKETNFNPTERKFGYKEDQYNGCLLYGSNDTKLIVKVERILEPKYVHQKHLIPKNKIEEFLPKTTPAQQGLEKEVVYRNYDLKNIRKIRLNQSCFKVID